MYVILACYDDDDDNDDDDDDDTFACQDDDDGPGADEGGVEEEDLVDTVEVGDAVGQGADQAPLLDQGDVGQSEGDPVAAVYVELLKLLRTVRLVVRGHPVLELPPAPYLEA